MVYWSRDPQPKKESQADFFYKHASSAEVEMTSYALLAFTVGNQSGAVSYSRPIAMWLITQRNAQGGFSSTQVLLNKYVKMFLNFFIFSDDLKQ